MIYSVHAPLYHTFLLSSKSSAKKFDRGQIKGASMGEKTFVPPSD